MKDRITQKIERITNYCMNDEILILAAGNSSRLGKNKQLLTINGESLIKRLVRICMSCDFGKINIVVGFQANQIKEQLYEENVNFIENKNWKEGIGSSISVGIRGISKKTTGAYILLPDQIKVSEKTLHMLQSYKQVKPNTLIACKYGESIGPPAFFPSKYFPELEKCFGHQGAKSILKKHTANLILCKFPQGEIDIDTEEDLTLLD